MSTSENCGCSKCKFANCVITVKTLFFLFCGMCVYVSRVCAVCVFVHMWGVFVHVWRVCVCLVNVCVWYVWWYEDIYR